MSKKIPSTIRKMLPWYVNGTLSAREMRVVDQYLRQNPSAMRDVDIYRQYRLRMKSWEQYQPPSRLSADTLRRARTPRTTRASWLHPYAWGAALTILILLWSVVRPGVVLEWDGAREDVSVFYIYRTAEDGEFRRIGTVPVSAETQKYTYVDTMLFPWESYTYVVQGVQGESVRALSGSVERDALAVLPVQLMLVALSVMLGYGLAGLLRRFPERVGGMGGYAS